MHRGRADRTTLRGLYAITPDTADTAALIAQVAAALEGGAALVQYRNKTAAPALRATQAAALHTLCRAHGTPLIINDDLALALTLEGAGLHLGGDDGDLASARARLGPGRLLGASCYNDFSRAARAAAAGADYLAFGAVFPSATKPGAVAAPLGLLTQARALGRPLAAIGGITLARAGAVLEAGADLLAVVSDVFEAPDIRAQARAYAQLFV